MVLPLRNIALGAIVLVLFALVLEFAMHWYILIHNPVTAAFFKTNLWAFAVYGAGAAGLYEETGRYIALRFLAKRVADPGTAVSYGIGHGGIEFIVVGAFAQSYSIVLAMMYQAGTLDAMLAKKVPAAALAKIHEGLAHLTFPMALVGGAERVCALLIQIALSLLVWRAVSRKEIRWYFLAILCHFAVDFPAALTQKGVIPIMATEAYVWVIGAALRIFFLIKLPKKQDALSPA